MNRRERRAQRKQQRKGKKNVCSSCGRDRPLVASPRDEKRRCQVCNDLHLKSALDDLDPGNASLAARLQKALQEAILTTVGRDPAQAPLVVTALGALAATYAVQLELVGLRSDSVSPADYADWQGCFARQMRSFHGQVAEALELFPDNPGITRQHFLPGTVGWLRRRLCRLPGPSRLVTRIGEGWRLSDDAGLGELRVRAGSIDDGVFYPDAAGTAYAIVLVPPGREAEGDTP